MVVEQRKPNMGGRKPSPTLWAMVRGLTEDEWRLMTAFSMVYGKGSLQFKLLTLLRSMEVYDPVAEKKAFEANDLYSMRRTARKWLIRTARRLALYQSEAYEQVLDLDVVLRWGFHEYTEETIAEAKQLATEQEEYTMLTSLYQNELRFVKGFYQGDERARQIVRVCDEAAENARLVQLGLEIERQSGLYLETARTRLLAEGKFDEAYTETYFQSKFYHQNIESWPISYQIQKLRIDEGLHYFLERTAEAAMAAEKLLDLCETLENIRQSQSQDHARCLFRLSAYYSALGKKQKVIQFLSVIRDRAMTDSPMRNNYLRRLPFSLYHAAFEFGIDTLAIEGLQVWNDYQLVVNSNSKDVIRFETLLRVCSHYLSVGDIPNAREVFLQAYEISDLFPYFTLQAVFKILHLMILLDEEDERGLQSFGKNYKRHLKANFKESVPSTVSSAALEVVVILCKASNLEGKPKLQKSLRLLLEKLHGYQKSTETTFKPYVYPMIKWTELRLRP